MLAVAVLVPAPARADSTAQAVQMFDEGKTLLKKEKWAEACEKFSGSNTADPSPGTQINLGVCHEKQNKIATAWGWYKSAANLARIRNQGDRAERAEAEATRLAPLLPKMILRLGGTKPEGLTISDNGAPIVVESIGSEMAVDPGEHAIEMTAKGKKPRKLTVTVAAPSATAAPPVKVVEIPAFEDAPEDKAVPAAAGTPGQEYRPPEGSTNTGSTQKTVGFIVGGAGILAAIAGGGLQIFNLAVTNKDAKDINNQRVQKNCGTPNAAAECGGPNGLDAAYTSKKDAANGNQTGALVLLIGGGALVVGGVVLVLTAGGGSKTGRNDRTMVVPIVGQGVGGVGLTGSF